MTKKYTDEEFIIAVKSSFTITEVLKKLNLQTQGSNFKHFKLTAKRLCLDISHFTGKGHLKGKTHDYKNPRTIPLEKILIKDSMYSSSNHLKKRLIKEKILEYKCYECGIATWRNKPISLHLEHKNGNNTDNRIENLTILCPNCHSQTKTFAGRNIKKHKKEFFCKECSKKITAFAKTGLCKNCCNKLMPRNMKVKNRPPKDILLNEIKETGYCAVGRKYGVSDNAVRKWLK